MHEVRDSARRIADAARHLAGAGEIGVQLFVLAAERERGLHRVFSSWYSNAAATAAWP
jgi:hypothetical protein